MAFDFEQAEQFLQLLGKNGATRLRAFWPRHVPVPNGTPRAFKADYTNAPTVLPTWQEKGLGVYVVIGNGGDIDDEITSCPALFIEWDDRPKAEQLTAWQEFDLPEPTFMVDTGGKSVHLYWVLTKPIPPDQFRDLIARLIKLTGADPTNRNPSRVMRLPGAWHFSWDPDAGQIRPNGQATIVSCSGHRYDADLFEELLPQIELDPPGLPLLPPSGDLPPRPIEQLYDAMQKVPEFHHGEGRYDELLKLAKRLHVEIGRDAAYELLRSHSPHVKDMAAYFTKAPDRISPGSIWPFLRDQYGIDIRRHDLKGTRAAMASPGPLEGASAAVGDGTPAAPGNGRGKRRTLAPDEVLQLLPERIGGTPRLNIRTNAFHAGGTIYTADDLARVYLHLSSDTERWTKEATCDAAVELAKNRAFDPVEEELNAISRSAEPLDDDHWQRLDRHLLGIDDPIAASFLPNFFIAAVARIYRPGCGVRRTPVLIGSQWRGKTRLGRILFGADHWIENISDLGKDDLMRLQAGWGVELSELNGITRRKDQEALKAFLTATDDVFRAPYGKGTARYQRRCVFWGTSNGPPLRDLSGSTRFVCIPLPDRMLPLEWAEKHRSAIWARAVAEFRQIPPGQEPWDMASEAEREAIQARNSNHQEIDPWADAVSDILKNTFERPVTIPHILDRMEIPMSQRNNAMASRIRQLAEAEGWVWDRRRSWAGGDKLRGLWPGETHSPNPGPPGPPSGPPDPAQDSASDTKGSEGAGPPGPPYFINMSGEGGKEGGEQQGEHGEGVGAFGGPRRPSIPNRLPGAGSGGNAGGPSGGPSGGPGRPSSETRETEVRQGPTSVDSDESSSGLVESPEVASGSEDVRAPRFVPGDQVAVLIEDAELQATVIDAPAPTGGLYRVRLSDGRELLKSEDFLCPWLPGQG